MFVNLRFPAGITFVFAESLLSMMVLLFDIDGTLIKTGGAGGAALMTAFSDLFDVADPREVPFSGRTDRGIARSLFRAHHIDDTDSNWHRLKDEYLRRLLVYLPQREGLVLPGISQLLGHLSERDDVALGLLTGNARDGARLKLEHFRLFHHFTFGGYGDHFVKRDDVARAALAASREHVRHDGPARPGVGYRRHANGRSLCAGDWCPRRGGGHRLAQPGTTRNRRPRSAARQL